MIVISKVTGISYEPENAVFFENALQSSKYFKHNAEILDIMISNITGKFIFVFSREDHERLKTAWNNHELD